MRACHYGAASAVIGYVCCYQASRLLAARVRGIQGHFTKLPLGDQAEWHTRVASTVHAVVQVLGSYYPALLSSDHLSERVRHYDTRLFVPYGITGLGPEFFNGLIVGYLLVDLAVVVWHADVFDGVRAAVVHHAMGAAGWCVFMGSGFIQWYGCFLQLTELSTMFVNTHWWLKKCDATDKRVYLVNGILLFLVFFLIRVASLPFTWAAFLMQDGSDLAEEGGLALMLTCVAGLLGNTVLQCLWFSMMLAAVVERFGPRKGDDVKLE
mmetsp:Transcript_57583/g.160368  ORF Transcript_57583/g.160368 Transcript_57583/m.160368 type:complete len:266 (+) Transcript_57583:53-850(+)